MPAKAPAIGAISASAFFPFCEHLLACRSAEKLETQLGIHENSAHIWRTSLLGPICISAAGDGLANDGPAFPATTHFESLAFFHALGNVADGERERMAVHAGLAEFRDARGKLSFSQRSFPGFDGRNL